MTWRHLTQGQYWSSNYIKFLKLDFKCLFFLSQVKRDSFIFFFILKVICIKKGIKCLKGRGLIWGRLECSARRRPLWCQSLDLWPLLPGLSPLTFWLLTLMTDLLTSDLDLTSWPLTSRPLTSALWSRGFHLCPLDFWHSWPLTSWPLTSSN